MALASLLHAQQSGEVKNVPSDFLQAKDFSRVVPQEKVYLHTDGNWYYPGDTIWYKAYVVRADDHRPTDMSRLLYVEFLNEQGYLVERQQLLLDSLGQASGQVATSDRLFPGFHEIRAYTKWMLNWGEQTLFSKVLPLYERLDDRSGLPSTEIPLKMTAGDYSIEYPLPRCNIRFYPEGGHMVYGLPARVAFELFNEETAPLQLSGVLLEDETPVQRIRSEHAGRGLFEFTPHQGHQYQVRFEWEGSVFTEEVKHIDEKGYTLRADIRENQLDIVVRNTLFGDMDEKTLRVLCRGVEEQAFPVPANTQETRCSVSIDSLRGGVNEVVLMDSKGGILLSRKVFIDKTEAYVSRCHISCEPSRLKPCGKVTLEIDWGAAFPNQSFSLAGHYVSPFPPDAQRYSDYWKKYSFMHRIDSVEIYTDLPRRPTCYDYVYPENLVYLNGTPSPMVTVGYINLKKYPQNGERFVEGRYINLMGCNKPATFYVPHYSGGLPPQQDFRRTLYWNPDIKTDANGKAKVEFFNNSTCQEMYISAEGITEDGRILVNE